MHFTNLLLPAIMAVTASATTEAADTLPTFTRLPKPKPTLSMEKQVGALCHDMLFADKTWILDKCAVRYEKQDLRDMCALEGMLDSASKECRAILVKAFGGGGGIEVKVGV